MKKGASGKEIAVNDAPKEDDSAQSGEKTFNKIKKYKKLFDIIWFILYYLSCVKQ